MASRQLWVFDCSVALESSARLAPVLGEVLSLRNRVWSLGGCGRRGLLFFFLLRQLLFLLRFLLGFPFSFLLPLDCRFLRRQDRVQCVALLPRPELHNALRFHVLDQPLQYLSA